MEEFIGITAPLYNDLIERGETGQHILIAGMTGSGKSVMMNGMINSILYKDSAKHQMILIDPKRVEFGKYKNTAHCINFSKTMGEISWILDYVRDLINTRWDEMDARGIDKWDGPIIHLFIDELAEITLTDKSITIALQSICQLGRAAGIQVIAATQCPLTEVIPTRIKVNFPITVGLHTASARHSRNILEVNGCEKLPLYGEALIKYPTSGIKHVSVPIIEQEWLQKIIAVNQRSNVWQ